MNFPVFDLHCDTASALLGEDHNSAGSLKKNGYHIDLERTKTFPGYAQCFAVYTTPETVKWYGISPVTMFERQLTTIQREVDANKRRMAIAYTPGDIKANLEKGKASAILTLEGTAGFGYDPGLLEDLSLIGFRMSTLTWNEQNPLAGSHLTGGGLTDQGREFVKEAQRIAMIVDVSHLSDEAFWDIMKITKKPIVASHSNLRSVCNHSRNLTEDMYRAIVQTGGTAGINLCAPFIKESGADFDATCDHIIRMLEIDPSGEHVSLGGDLDGCDELPAGFVGIESYNALADRLMERGLDEKTIRNIYWHNTMGVMDRAVRNHQK